MSTAQTRPERTAAAPPPDPETELKVVEALIFVSDEPITLGQIAEVVPGRSPDEIRALVEELSQAMQGTGRGLRIEEVAGGFRFSTRPELAPWIRTHFRNRNRARLSPASIETLAVIAYKQPVTGPEIQEIRGVDPQGAIKTLLEKRLIRIAGKKKVVGRPFLYKTTREFLMHFGLAGIEDLPPIEDFERLAGEFVSASAEESDPAHADDDPQLVAESGNGHVLHGNDDSGPEGEGEIEAEPGAFDPAASSSDASSDRPPARSRKAGGDEEDDDDDEEDDENEADDDDEEDDDEEDGDEE